MNTQEERTWSMLAHLSSLAALLFTGLGFICGFIGPLIIWLLKKDQSHIVAENAKEALNFNISYTIYSLIAVMLVFLLVGFLLVPIVYVVWLVFAIIATVKTNQGQYYRYPFIFRFIR
ncbi:MULTISPECIES: DUF4870 domain-containing protein [Paenibacillus]|uniref:DUF4870 domain-containing protein n=1 Tax=Paenibacillus TaxID=44249 RepID=UPI00203EB0AB|nr:DUF4870 domain-containing protein [Paenibacillus camelliae]MCM3635295.1 DUF4870 domain-containing protein [Paenibacillus camelliae]